MTETTFVVDVDSHWCERPDDCGIDAQVIFPSTIGPGGQDLGMVTDEALRRLTVEGLSPEARSKIFGENARKLYRL